MKTYPYIGKCEENNLAVIFTSFRSGTTLHCGSSDIAEKHKYETGFNEREFKNITAEYLTNTYGKVESKEHADFLIKLAGENKIEISIGGYSERKNYFYFTEDEDLLYLVFASFSPSNRHTSITLPLPPKEKSMESQKEWPAVGDEVLTLSDSKAVVLAVDKREAWIKFESGSPGRGYSSVLIDKLKKPPTPDEELESELRVFIGANAWESCKDLAEAIINGEIEGLEYKPQ